MIYEVEIGNDIYIEKEISTEVLSAIHNLSSTDYDKPFIEGIGKYRPRFEVLPFVTFEGLIIKRKVNSEDIDLRRCDAKHNLYHHSTRQRIIHREGRLAKLSQR